MAIEPSQRLAALFDRAFTRRHTEAIERTILSLAVAGFPIHLSLIFAAGALGPRAGVLAPLDVSYLSALYISRSAVSVRISERALADRDGDAETVPG